MVRTATHFVLGVGCFLVAFGCWGCPEVPLVLLPECVDDSPCDDGLFCNGFERCVDSVCVEGDPPCLSLGEDCITCIEPGFCNSPCTSDLDCDDTVFCNGAEICEGCVCVHGQPPCESAAHCNESSQSCDDCISDDECESDDIDCTDDVCLNGVCVSLTSDDNCPEVNPVCLDEHSFSFELRDNCLGCCSPCRSQCSIGIFNCSERSIEEYPDFNTHQENLGSKYIEGDCAAIIPEFIGIVIGECSDGKLFLIERLPFTFEVRFFNADTHAFVGLQTGTDGIGPFCLGRGYWPELINCKGAITEVICGDAFEVGDTVTFSGERQ